MVKFLYSGTTLCPWGVHLFTATCDSSGFVITVDETCRRNHYGFIDWAGEAFLYGDPTKTTKAAVYVMDKNIFLWRQILDNLGIFLSIWIYALSCSKLLMLTTIGLLPPSQPINVFQTDPAALGNLKLLTSLNVVSLLLLMASNIKSLPYYFYNYKNILHSLNNFRIIFSSQYYILHYFMLKRYF